MKQMTKEQAIALWESNKWVNWSDKQIVALQLYQKRICVPFDRFHGAMEAELGRPILTHEFAHADHLIEEYEGKRDKPTFQSIIDLLPAEKVIMIEIGK